MGLIVKNTTFDSSDDELPIGSEVIILETKEQGSIIMKIGNLYQIKKEDGNIMTYARSEIAKK